MLRNASPTTAQSSACLPSTELAAYLSRELHGRRNEAVYTHLKHCADCLRQLAKLSKHGAAPMTTGLLTHSPRPGLWQRVWTWLTRRPPARD